MRVIAAGCFLWAAMTACFGLARSLWQGILVWAVNGAGDSLLPHKVIHSVRRLIQVWAVLIGWGGTHDWGAWLGLGVAS